ncbi:LuxR C-terminal-related transcriptional regulator [Pricia sp.]|uniref:LuxR C-terminal-related transcriptional regulator n=1 Tax=Pricia sp. TaxID=2268138 RepID=UPI003593DA81
MKTEIKVLRPLDAEKFRTLFSYGDDYCKPQDALRHYEPLIQSFEKLAVGRFFWFIGDFANCMHCFAGGDIENLTPFKMEDFATMSHLRLHEATHPEDLQKVLAFSKIWVELFVQSGAEFIKNLNVSLFFRMMDAKKNYYWIMVQYAEPIPDKNGKAVYGLVLATDISHIKKEGVPMMNILNTNTQTCQQFFCMENGELSQEECTVPLLTKREKEVLSLLTRGHGSKQIAHQLFVSVKTVDNHRQNMLHKTGSRSSSELVSLGIRLGIV